VHSILAYVLLAILQGITEFLPVSSSGHLVAARTLLGMEDAPLLLEVSLHFGTLLAILVVFRNEIIHLVADAVRGVGLLLGGTPPDQVKERAPSAPMALAVVVGTLPAAAAGLLFHDRIEGLFAGKLAFSGSMMLVTGCILLAARFLGTGERLRVGPPAGLLVGLAQACALLPGISRSGITIVAGYSLGLTPSLAARFSFLLAVPVVGGAMLLETVRTLGGSASSQGGLAAGELPGMGLGVAASALVGWLCLRLLLRVIRGGKLHWFAAYCLPAGAVFLILGLLR